MRFIQHKVSRCNKENVQPAFDGCHDDDEDDDDNHDGGFQSNVERDRCGGGEEEQGGREPSLLATIISSHRTSISAPINRKDPEVTRHKDLDPPSSSVSTTQDLTEQGTNEKTEENEKSLNDHNATQENTTTDKANGDDDNNEAQKEEGTGSDSDDVKIIENGIESPEATDGELSKKSGDKDQPTSLGKPFFSFIFFNLWYNCQQSMFDFLGWGINDVKFIYPRVA